MKRREFLRFGAVAAGAPAVLPLLNLSCTGGAPASGAEQAGDLRISSNENPLGVPESLRDAIVRGLSEAHQYPGGSAGRLSEALALRHGVEREAIVLGNGSTDILRMAVQSSIARGPDVRLVAADPTFEQFEAYARPLGVQPALVPLLPDTYGHDLDGMREAAAGADAALVYICNPNNPTGGVTPVPELKAWIEDAPPGHHFLVDEAYFEFADDPSYEPMIDWARERPNVVAVRTFSKVYGMAGIRVGYAVAHPDTASGLRAFAVATSPNHLGNVAGLAALEDENFVQRSLEMNRESKRITCDTLDALELPWMESHTNFVMHAVNGDVATYQSRMREEGILVGRPFPPLLEHNRISLGTPEQMERWGETLRSFRERGWV